MSAPILLALRIALVLLLYGFLGFALLVLWRDLRRQSRLVAAKKAPALILKKLVDGDAPARSFTNPEVTVGRDPASDFCLEDPTISAQHARLSYHHGQWWIEDLRSTNGTYLNQEPVVAPLVITSGDQLRFGQVALLINLEEGRTDPDNFEPSLKND